MNANRRDEFHEMDNVRSSLSSYVHDIYLHDNRSFHGVSGHRSLVVLRVAWWAIMSLLRFTRSRTCSCNNSMSLTLLKQGVNDTERLKFFVALWSVQAKDCLGFVLLQ